MTTEYQTLLVSTLDLQLAVKHDIVGLGGALVAEGLITTAQYEALRNPFIEKSMRAADLIQIIQDKVRQNLQHYHTFVAVLNKDLTQYHDILQKLQETYNQQGIPYYLTCNWLFIKFVCCLCLMQHYNTY